MKLDKFLILLFKKLEKKKINYCILRNYKSLPKKLNSNDIDILVNNKDLRFIIKTIQRYCNIVLINQRDYLVGLTLNGIENSNNNFLKIDLITKIAWKGLSYLDNETIFDHKIKYKEKFFIPQKHHEPIITFFSSYLIGGWINKKYQKDIRNQFIKNKKKINETLELKFSKSLIDLINKGISARDHRSLTQNVNKLRLELIIYYIKKDKFKCFIKIFQHYLKEIKMRYSDYAMTRLYIEYENQISKQKFDKLLNNDIKVFFKYYLIYKKENFIKDFFRNFQNPYKLPLLIINESIKTKIKNDRLPINFYKPYLSLKIKSKKKNNFLKYKNEIIKYLKFNSNKRIINEFFN